jgi:hypothetical protein
MLAANRAFIDTRPGQIVMRASRTQAAVVFGNVSLASSALTWALLKSPLAPLAPLSAAVATSTGVIGVANQCGADDWGSKCKASALTTGFGLFAGSLAGPESVAGPIFDTFTGGFGLLQK